MKWLIALSVAITLAGIAYMVYAPQTQTHEEESPKAEPGQPTFTWSYTERMEKGIPYTEIMIIATYESGATLTKPVDRVEGNCNGYEPADADVYERSTMIICYYAGLGRYFKVVAEDGEYRVLRKIFEEASPDYDPPVQPYEPIVRF